MLEVIDNYPTEKSLDLIRAFRGEAENLLYELGDYFSTHGHFSVEEITRTNHLFEEETILKYSISTGGWSGCEDVMEALRQNFIFWALNWVSHYRGGHYTFEIVG